MNKSEELRRILEDMLLNLNSESDEDQIEGYAEEIEALFEVK